MMDGKRILTFDVGSRFIRHTIVTDGRPAVPSSFATAGEDSVALFDSIADAVRRPSNGQVDGVALSLPGFVDVRRQRVMAGGSINALYRQNVGDELHKRLGDDLPIWVENDANCVAIAEKHCGNARKLDDFVVFTVTDTGVGGSLFLDGHIRRGRDWRAGEIGMMITNYQTQGAKTLHEFSSTNSLGQRYVAKYGGQAQSIVPSGLLRRMDEPDVRDMVDEWMSYIAVGIFNVIVSVDPECVLLGGAICQEPSFLPLVRQALEELPSWKDFNTPVKRCRNAGNAELLGAYYAFMTELG
ncbi:ROK family protein [Bifidobacterium myosotis]|uniref:ROK family protein n=2 Tax=Bifidobacterium myosotis TaxID=1630166 RepID=A0A5M9ZR65_9BIFI|nr:ROK family protein [Bifidobacterium myosotis]